MNGAKDPKLVERLYLNENMVYWTNYYGAFTQLIKPSLSKTWNAINFIFLQNIPSTSRDSG